MASQIAFGRSDFRNARPHLTSLRRLRPKFRILEDSLLEILPRQFDSMKKSGQHFVSRPNRRGGGYWHGIWLGLAGPRFDNPRRGLQFQFGIDDGAVFCCGIWMQGRGQAPIARKMAWSAINRNPEKFCRLIRRLGPQYYVQIWNGVDFWKSATEFSTSDVDALLDHLADSQSFLNISRRLTNMMVTSWKKRLPSQISVTFERLYPLYTFLSSGQPQKKRGSVPPPTKILQSSMWAEALAKSLEVRKGRIVKVVSNRPVGYDLESTDRKSGRIRRIEVKSRKIPGRIQLTPNEYRAAIKYGSDYYVYIVRSRNMIAFIRNPAESCAMLKRNQPVWEIANWSSRARTLK